MAILAKTIINKITKEFASFEKMGNTWDWYTSSIPMTIFPITASIDTFQSCLKQDNINVDINNYDMITISIELVDM